MHWSEARDLVRKWREENVRKSQELVDIWEQTLKNKAHKLGDEQYLVLEQVCVAALDCHRLEVAGKCLQQLSYNFPGSLRIRSLQALHFEAIERYDEALEFLDSIIKRDETNPAPRKRKVAIFKARGRIQDAIKELTEYLKKFMIDQEAWQELSELYLLEQEYSKAAFCMEELILHNPHNHLFHQRLADIKYTQGGYDNLDLAKSYYCQAIKLNPMNMRALYGLVLTCYNLIASQKCTSAKKKEANNLITWALKRIQERYRTSNIEDNQVSAIENLMSSLQINTAPNL
uniref:ER membrane protein complex subunit 2 n=1 Tax=Triatoma infestans TaxID=30076 RepID=A0A023F9W7_TRIIF